MLDYVKYSQYSVNYGYSDVAGRYDYARDKLVKIHFSRYENSHRESMGVS